MIMVKYSLHDCKSSVSDSIELIAIVTLDNRYLLLSIELSRAHEMHSECALPLNKGSYILIKPLIVH